MKTVQEGPGVEAAAGCSTQGKTVLFDIPLGTWQLDQQRNLDLD
jgi:hypothetical protein